MKYFFILLLSVVAPAVNAQTIQFMVFPNIRTAVCQI
jgi:hypothetical protein